MRVITCTNFAILGYGRGGLGPPLSGLAPPVSPPPPGPIQPAQVIDYGHGQDSKEGSETDSRGREEEKDRQPEKELPAAYREDGNGDRRVRESSRDQDLRERDRCAYYVNCCSNAASNTSALKPTFLEYTII